MLKTKKTGQISTAAAHLQTVAYQHPVVSLLIKLSSLNNIKSNFIKGLGTVEEPGKYIHPVTGRLHPSVNQVRASTGRLAYLVA